MTDPRQTAEGRQQQFKYQRADIRSSKLDDFFIDIRAMIVELVFFEALDKPYISGQIVISDDKAIFDGLQFSGTEKLHIKMLTELTPYLGPNKDEGVVMDREFLLTGIEAAVKSSNSGSSSVYVLSFMDEHALISKSKLVSRSISGSLTDEILKLCGNELGKNVDESYYKSTPNKPPESLIETPAVQTNFKGIIPYMHPLEAATWLCQKATTQLGMPFFLYASIHDESLRLGSLEKMVQQVPWNAESPYIFSPANTQKQETSPDVTLQYFQVQAMKMTKVQNTMKQFMTGGVGSRFTVTDISNGRNTSKHFNFYESLQRADDLSVINLERQNVHNATYKTPDISIKLDNGGSVNLEGDNLHNLDGQTFHKVVSRGVYGDFKSIHDEVGGAHYLKQIENLAYRNAIFKNMIDVTVPGPGFIASDGSVGDRVRIHVLSDDNDPDSPSQLDEMRSGDFLIYNTRHTFKDTRHDVAMTVFKLERGPSS